jgi:hypothetical protein
MLKGSFTKTERDTLRALRARYQDNQDIFSPEEMARLRFQRWRYETGRLVSSAAS